MVLTQEHKELRRLVVAMPSLLEEEIRLHLFLLWGHGIYLSELWLLAGSNPNTH